MNSPFKFLRRVRIHGGECGAVARALHHKAKFSSPAVFESVSSTTYERKQMTNKSISFKRIALALVAALGFGVLSSGPSSSLPLNPTLALSASSASIALDESATVTIDVTLTGLVQNETITVQAVNSNAGAATWTSEHLIPLTTDSVNVATHDVGRTYLVNSLTTADTTVVAASAAGTYSRAKWEFRAVKATAAGTDVWTIRVLDAALTVVATGTFTVTVAAADLTAVASKTLFWINDTLAATTGRGRSADSALVVSANTPRTGATTPVAYGAIWPDFRNAADTNVAGILGSESNVDGSLVLNVSGPGWLAKPDHLGGESAKAKSVTLARGDTAIIYSDGTPGTMTITGYIGSTALTQAAKTVTFYGKAVTLTATETTVVGGGALALSSRAADSITVGTKLVTFTAKDSAGNLVKTASMNVNNGLWCISSDTSVVGTGTGTTSTNAYVAATAPTGTSSTWSCDMVVRKAGTASITVADDTVVATAAYTSTAKSFTFAAPINSTTKGTGTIAFDKTTYQIGEKAMITVTVTSAGAVPGQLIVGGDTYATANVFPTLIQNRAFSGIGYDAAGNAIGFGTSRTGTTFDISTGTFLNGVETYVVLMPTVAGDVTITGFTTDGTYDTATAVSVTLKVVDPNAALIAASQAATVAAAEAATDAAAEAIDAANAATDAANLAAEAADAATVAAEEARDAADAATAAVEELATAVATLMAALKAQITTLANTVAKIAKKVKA